MVKVRDQLHFRVVEGPQIDGLAEDLILKDPIMTKGIRRVMGIRLKWNERQDPCKAAAGQLGTAITASEIQHYL